MGESAEDSQPQQLEPPGEEAKVVSGSGQDNVDGVSGRVGEIVAAHSVLGLEVADDRFDGGSPSHLSLICGAPRRFWPAVKTLNFYSGGALWPRYPTAAKMRSRMLPTSASIAR
jgi:hypothetical protein